MFHFFQSGKLEKHLILSRVYRVKESAQKDGRTILTIKELPGNNPSSI